MAEIISHFVDGKLLVHEDRRIGEICVISGAGYITSGIPVRIGSLRKVESVIALDNSYSQYGLITRPWEVTLKDDYAYIVMRRNDIVDFRDVMQGGFIASGLASGLASVSGALGRGLVSGITSGVGWLGEPRSGANVSGVRIFATVVGY